MLSAEIDWRLGNNQSAAERLNTLRNRACKGQDHSMDITTSEVTQDFLLDENAREMIGEWHNDRHLFQLVYKSCGTDRQLYLLK